MKRLVLHMLFSIIFACFLCGCGDVKKENSGTQYEKIDYSQIDYKNEKASFAERDKKLVVVTEQNLEAEVSATALWFMRSQEEVQVVVEVLAQDEEERTGQLQEMRTEIMAGKGPDLFVMELQSEITLGSDENVPLFANVNKAIESGFFESLTSYMETDGFWEDEPVRESFLKVGQMDGEQYVLPLSCEYYVFAGKDVENIDLGENIVDWMSYINATEDTILKKNVSLITFQAARLLQPAVDYEKQNVTMQKEEWVAYMTEQVMPYRVMWNSLEKVEEEQYSMSSIMTVLSEMQMSENAFSFCETIPGLLGEYKATISTWGAVGRNSNHKQSAYDFLMLFLNNYVAEENDGKEGEISYYPGVDECVGVSGVPVHDEAFEKYMERKGLSEEQQKIILESFNQIDTAYFPTEVEALVYNEVQNVYRDYSGKMKDEWESIFQDIADMAEEKYTMLAKE